MRALRPLLLTVLVPGLLAVPVLTASASAGEPVAVPPRVQELGVSGVDATAARGSSPSGVTGALVDGDGRRTVLLTGELATRPFAVVGVTWDADPAVTTVESFVRTRVAGTWSSWQVLGGRSDEEPDAGTPDTGATLRGGTAPLWVDDADGVQVRVDVLAGADPHGLRVSLVDPGEAEQDLALSASASTGASSAPVVRSRREWGADESIRRGSPAYASGIHAVTVHHTASSNDYTAADVPRLIRGFYAYHVTSNGWSDIGYNFLVDKFGRIWEGRAGGTSRPVIGSHAGGFNTGTVGISMIGTYDTLAPPAALREAVASIAGWRLGLAGRDPRGSVDVRSGGSTRYAAGTVVTLPRVFGHRQVSTTACPGDQGMAALPAIRDRAVALAAGAAPVPPPAVSTPAPPPVPNGLDVTAPAVVDPGTTVPLVVRGTPGAAVQVWFRRRGEEVFTHRRDGVLGADGTWRTSYLGYDEHSFYAVSGGRTSRRVTTRLTSLPALTPAPPTTVTVAAPPAVDAGTGVPVEVRGPAGAEVDVWFRRRGSVFWTRLREGRFDASGLYRTDFPGEEDHDYYATSGGVASRDVQTLVVPVLTGPRSAAFGTRVDLVGRARPGASVVVESRRRGQAAFSRATLVADASGAFRTPLSVDDEYEYRPLAEDRTGSLHRTTVAPTAAAPDVVPRGTAAAVTGTARPGALVELVVRRARPRGLPVWDVARTVTAGADGRWATAFAPVRASTWYVRSDGNPTARRTTGVR